MEHFLTKTGLLFTLFINEVKTVFAKKTRNLLIISPPHLQHYFNWINKKILHKSFMDINVGRQSFGK